MSNNISNKKTKLHNQLLDRELHCDPLDGNYKNKEIDTSTKLRDSKNTYRRKEQMILNGFDNRRLTITGESKRVPLNYGSYILNGNKSEGRGFGDYDASQDLRFGIDTRQEKKTAASTDLTDFKLGDNYYTNFNLSGDVMPSPEIIHLVNGNNNVLPFPRGGVDTRNLDKYRRN